MTENERSLIEELEALGALPWERGMLVEVRGSMGKEILTIQDVDTALETLEFHNPYLYGIKSASMKICTHVPCDALIGYLVGRLQGTKHNLEIRCYSDHAIVEWRKHPAAPLCFKGKTLLEALLLAFEAKLEAEK